MSHWGLMALLMTDAASSVLLLPKPGAKNSVSWCWVVATAFPLVAAWTVWSWCILTVLSLVFMYTSCWKHSLHSFLSIEALSFYFCLFDLLGPHVHLQCLSQKPRIVDLEHFNKYWSCFWLIDAFWKFMARSKTHSSRVSWGVSKST